MDEIQHNSETGLRSEIGHDPVLLREVLEALSLSDVPGQPPATHRTYVDCTLGRGGHALEIAKRLNPNDQLIAIDADPRNLEFASTRLEPFKSKVRFFHANFRQLEDVLDEVGSKEVNGILADLGVSTNQIFDARYGLSFALDAPLDMRLNPDESLTADQIVNTWPERKLADMLYQNADERFSRRIARKIVEERAISPIKTTRRLAEIVRSCVPPVRSKSAVREPIDPATRTFLALRMQVNAEAENLKALIDQASARLASEGRLAIISFQSAEDRIVKHAFKALEETNRFEVLTKKPIVPTDEEIESNPRSRSSKMRVLKRVT